MGSRLKLIELASEYGVEELARKIPKEYISRKKNSRAIIAALIVITGKGTTEEATKKMRVSERTISKTISEIKSFLKTKKESLLDTARRKNVEDIVHDMIKARIHQGHKKSVILATAEYLAGHGTQEDLAMEYGITDMSIRLMLQKIRKKAPWILENARVSMLQSTMALLRYRNTYNEKENKKT